MKAIKDMPATEMWDGMRANLFAMLARHCEKEKMIEEAIANLDISEILAQKHCDNIQIESINDSRAILAVGALSIAEDETR